MDETTPSAEIRPRAPRLTFDAELPRHWLGGSAVATHMANGVNLLFPAGERMFVRSMRRYLDGLDDAELRARVRGFFGQEGQHARAHERYFRVLEAQGYAIGPFLKFYERLAYGVIERLAPPLLRLSVTVALEHYTAIMAELALRERMLDAAPRAMRELLLWHAAEEIEHKSVAFDVLARVEPSYALRMAGLVVATACLAGFWAAATGTLLWQDRDRGATLADLRAQQRERPVVRRVFLRGIREYVRRDFHPAQNDNLHLARTYLADAGLA